MTKILRLAAALLILSALAHRTLETEWERLASVPVLDCPNFDTLRVHSTVAPKYWDTPTPECQ